MKVNTEERQEIRDAYLKYRAEGLDKQDARKKTAETVDRGLTTIYDHTADLELAVNEQPRQETQRWLILPDLQIPYHDDKSLNAVLEYASTQRWDGFIQLGDFMDWDFCSRWTVDNARAIEGKRFLAEYAKGNAVLDQICAAARTLNPGAPGVIIQGNHDYRVEVVIDKTPALEGLIEMESSLRLAERNITYWKYWEHHKPYILGHAWFIHGQYTNDAHAKKTALAFGKSVFYGHVHDRQGYTKTSPFGESIYCEALGTLSKFDLDYMGQKPSNWMQCFAEFYIRPDGNFNHYVTNITNNGFTAPDGLFYQG